MSETDKVSGLTLQEQKVMDLIASAHGSFLELERTHPDEERDFVDAIHKIQAILGLRILRRGYPQYWLTHKDSEVK